MKLIKWLLWIVLFVAVVAAGGVIFLITKVDPNDLKPQISQKVESLTGRKLDLKGDLSWRFYPWVGVTLNEFSLSNRSGFSPENMLNAEYVDVQLKLLPLLSKQIEVGKIKLQAPTINLSVNAAGETNWGDLAGAEGGGSKTASPEQDASAMVGGLVIQGVDISQGEIDWNNEQAGQQYHLSGFELVTDEIQPQMPIGFDLKTGLSGTDIPDAATIRLNGAINVGEAFDSVKLAYLNVEAKMQETEAKVELDALSFVVATGELLAKEIKANVKMPDLAANMAVNSISFSTESNQALVERLVGTVAMNEINADLDAEKIRYAVDSAQLAIKAIKYSGKHEIGQFEGEADTLAFDVNKSTLSLAGNTLMGQVEALPVQLMLENLHLNLDAETLSIPNLEIRSDAALIQANVDVTQLMGDLQASGHLSSNTLNPRQLLAQLKMDEILADIPAPAMEAVKLETDFKGGLMAASLENLMLVLDQSTLKGSLSAGNFDRQIPSARFDLELDQINLNQYMAGQDTAAVKENTDLPVPAAATGTQVAAPASASSGKASADTSALPFEMLKGMDAKGLMGIGELRVDSLLVNDVVVQVDTENDRIEITPLSAQAYGGQIVNTLVYDVSGKQPSVEIQSALTSLNIGPLLQALDVTDRLEGFGGMKVDLHGSGLNSTEITSTLNGEIDLQLKDGAISGVSLQDTLLKIESLYKQLKGKDLGLQGEVSDKTEFSSFAAKLIANNGVLNAQDINLMAPAIRVSGGGNIDLNTEQLDLLLNIAVVASFEGQGGQTLDKLKGMTIPVAISGHFDSPKIRPDLSQVAKQELEKELSKKYLGTEVSGDNFEAALGAKLSESLNKELGIEPESAPDADASSTNETATEADKPAANEKPKSTEDQLKDQLKNSLMKSIFGG